MGDASVTISRASRRSIKVENLSRKRPPRYIKKTRAGNSLGVLFDRTKRVDLPKKKIITIIVE
jgi:hypothetical protein